VIAPPLAIDGAALTIRKFKKDRLKLEQLVKFGSISPRGKILEIIGRDPMQRDHLRRYGLG
jgi:pilus assembly protein CpaF